MRSPSNAQALWIEASRARRRAYAPYSRFTVGAALLCADGRVFRGANVENASYGLSVCAERVAVWKAVSEGVRGFSALAVAGPPGRSTPPCGACRQILLELAPELRIYWKSASGRMVARSVAALLPEAFRLPSRARR